MVSAVADFLPQEEGAMVANEPFVYHSKVRAQQLRDAFSQTSDTEEQPARRRPAYEQRRATTEALMNFASKRQAEEANTYVVWKGIPCSVLRLLTFFSTNLV